MKGNISITVLKLLYLLRLISLFIFYFCFSSSSFAQIATNEKSDTTKLLELYSFKSDSLLFKKEYRKSLESIKKLIKLSEASKDTFYQAKAYYFIGELYTQTSNEKQVALDFYLKALKLSEVNNYYSLNIYINQSLSNLYLKLDEPDKAFTSLKQSQKISEQQKDTANIILTYSMLAEFFRHQKSDYDSAFYYYERGYKIAHINKNYYYESFCLIELGCLNAQFNKINVIEYYNQGLEIALNHNISTNNAHYHFANYYMKLNQPDKAIRHYEKALVDFKKWRFMRAEIYSQLAKLEEDLQHYLKAIEYLKLYQATKDSIAEANKLENTAKIELLFELDKIDKHNKQSIIESNLKTQLETRKRKAIQNYFILEALIFLLIVYILIWQYRRKKKESLVLSQKNNEIKRISEKLHKADKAKLDFFINISHELRTPLTLLISPVEKLLSANNISNQKQLLQYVYRNAQKLKNLLSQLLDLSKLDANKLELNFSNYNVNEILDGCYDLFRPFAIQKKIDFTISKPREELYAKVDKERIEQVINNLLSNAFKFTNVEGKVDLSLSAVDNKVIIKVKDNGIGIPIGEQEKIFSRFYQSNNELSNKFSGSGIGLAFAKEVINLHKGEITVNSALNEYTEFTISLTLSRQLEIKEDDNPPLSPIKIHKPGNTFIKGSLLVVEDDDDLRNYLKDIFYSNQLKIILALNGKEGIKLAKKHFPDIIISDIMMPYCSGYELLEELKSNLETSHIPIILLTSKTERDEKLKGLNLGADDYLEKPFDVKELEIKVGNLLNTRKQLQEKYIKQINVLPSEITTNSLDEKLLIHVTEIIEKNISNSGLSIDTLSKEVGLSRQHLHRKIKVLTDLTPSQFINSIRLKRAAQLLKQKSGSVSEIAFQTGFENLSYFTKKFKEFFQVLPSEYI